MKTPLYHWQFVGFLFTAIAGTLLHFLFDWTNQSALVAPFSAVNESIWEHMKLLFFPMFTFSILEYQFLGDNYKNFWNIKLIGILLGVILIPILYYTYTGAFGTEKDWINILIFYTTATFAYALETWLFMKKDKQSPSGWGPFILLSLIALVFIILTYVPPEIPLFQEPGKN